MVGAILATKPPIKANSWPLMHHSFNRETQQSNPFKMMIKFFFLFAVLVAGSSAHPGIELTGVIGTHAQSYNAHAINHAYGFAAPAVPAYSLYTSPGYIAAYNAPLIAGRR